MSDKEAAEFSIKILGVTINYSLAFITFILGYFINRFSMTRNEKAAHSARIQEQSNKLSEALNQKFNEFMVALAKYANKVGEPNLDDFSEVSLKGEAYFTHLKIICDTILSDNIDASSIRNTHSETIKEAIEKTIPAYYSTLQEVAERCHLSYTGEFKRSNYKSVFEVYERYCKV